jgi:predicted nucleotidyltransferase
VVTTLERLLAAGGYRLDLQVEADAPLLDWVRGHRQQIIELAAARGAGNVRLFGSVVRGESGADSDIDILVDFDTSHGLRPLLELADELEALLGRHVDVAPVELLKAEVAERALAEALPL